jgi:hypothetical protein
VTDFHDAVIEELSLDYAAGSALVVFRKAAGRVNLVAEGVLLVRRPDANRGARAGPRT